MCSRVHALRFVQFHPLYLNGNKFPMQRCDDRMSTQQESIAPYDLLLVSFGLQGMPMVAQHINSGADICQQGRQQSFIPGCRFKVIGSKEWYLFAVI